MRHIAKLGCPVFKAIGIVAPRLAQAQSAVVAPARHLKSAIIGRPRER